MKRGELLMLDDFREWLSDNLRYILLGLAVVLIVVIGFSVVRLVTSSSDKKKPEAGKNGTEQVTEAVTEGGVQNETAAPADADLVKDDTAILTLMKSYYEAAAAKDTAALKEIYDPSAWNEVVENAIKSNVIESYQDVSTYSKKGPVDGSYVVYNYYKAKVANIDTLAPSLTGMYVITDASGKLVISKKDATQEISDYIDTVTADADVQALMADVNSQLQEAVDSDPKLEEFLNANSGSSDSDGEGNSNSGNVAGEMVSTTELRIRQEPNTSSAIMGVVTTGAAVTVLQEVEDGWCQISYNAGSYNIEGYVKSEYLTAAGGSGAADTGTADAAAGGEDSGASDAGAAATSTGGDGTGAADNTQI